MSPELLEIDLRSGIVVRSPDEPEEELVQDAVGGHSAEVPVEGVEDEKLPLLKIIREKSQEKPQEKHILAILPHRDLLHGAAEVCVYGQFVGAQRDGLLEL